MGAPPFIANTAKIANIANIQNALPDSRRRVP
jgi:hypothetical protein